MKIEKFNITDFNIDIAVAFEVGVLKSSPRISIVFYSDGFNRRIPMPVECKEGRVTASGIYNAADIFYGSTPDRIKIGFVFSDGTDTGRYYDTDLFIDGVKKRPFIQFMKASVREKAKKIISLGLNAVSLIFRPFPIKQNRISFFTNRTDEPTGNLRAVYNTVKDMENVDVHLICKSGGIRGTVPVLLKFLRLYMTSRIVYIDDYYHLISYIRKKKGTALIQLWHGCGAFKTFGFSRFHKESHLQLYSANHRQYDYAVVSSDEVIDFYAEAFGINREKVKALGSPRCDILTETDYRDRIRSGFFAEHPQLKGKKILLFAPTFRGDGNGDCYYPVDKFDVDKVLDILGEEWAIVIKLHPYLTEKFTCSERNSSRMADCSHSDVNDILLVTDFLVTDYSSVIFEASILDIPMAFYTFDLEEFIEKRDFYFDFKLFVPGPIVKTDDELAQLIKSGGGDINAVREFKQRAFGSSLGNACDNIRQLTEQILNNEV
ncbi:MAG: CDP-glycerol glycerophosphotransferase family protein [Eubacterium sp.]